MTVIQAGVPKSGNYWLYKIISAAIKESRPVSWKSYIRSRPIFQDAQKWELSTPEQLDQNVLDIEEDGCYYRISSLFREKVPNMGHYMNSNTLSWTHSKIVSTSENVLARFDKIVYIIRDPRDVAISMANFVFTPYMLKNYPSPYKNVESFLEGEFAKQLDLWEEHVLGYYSLAKSLNILIVFYERLMADFDYELRRVASYLGLEPSKDFLNAIRDKATFAEMKKASPYHVRKGKYYQWQTELTDAQVELANERIGKTLVMFGYPTKVETGSSLPDLPKSDK